MARRFTKRKAEADGVIIGLVPDHPGDLVAQAAAALNISRQAAYQRVMALVSAGILAAEGATRSRKYSLLEVQLLTNWYPSSSEEHLVWSQEVRPILGTAPDNVLRICEYVVGEIINNAIDHSEAAGFYLNVSRKGTRLTFDVYDQGVGVFEKVRAALHLADAIDSVLELMKGKVTTDPTRHTGEGIFFTSRLCDEFALLANGVFWSCGVDQRDWLLQRRASDRGTLATMIVDTRTSRTTKEIFDRYSSGENYEFLKTEVPIYAAKMAEGLISRSAAKRVLSRLEQFREVYLDFESVESIGQPFADEVFRVFAREHPEVTLHVANANDEVEAMIRRAKAGAA